MKVRCKVKVGFFTCVLVGCIALTAPRYFFALLFSVSIHEAGHIILAILRGINLKELRLGIFGAALCPVNLMYSYKDEIVMCIGGPLFNFISAVIAIKIFSFSINSLFVMSSICLATLNMLPIIGFDGGRITIACLNMILDPLLTQRVMKTISFIFIFSLWTMSLYLLLRLSSSLTLFVFCISMFAKIFIPDAV